MIKRLYLPEASEQLVANALGVLATMLDDDIAAGAARGERSRELEAQLRLIRGDGATKGLLTQLRPVLDINPRWEPL